MVSTQSILAKKIGREIKKSWKQFLAIIFIACLAVCLFVGLTANYKSLEKRVENLYKQSNMADLFTTVSVYQKEDEDYFKSLDNVDIVDKRFTINTYLNGKNSNALIVDDYVLSTPLDIVGEKGLLIDPYFAETLKIKNGDYVDITFSTTFIQAFLMKLLNFDGNKEGLVYYLNQFVTAGKQNVFIQDNIKINAVVTGTMNHPENIEKGSYSTSNYVMEKEYFFQYFKQIVAENYNKTFLEKFELFAKNVPVYNQYLIKTKKNADINDLQDKIINYYHSKGENSNLIMCLMLETLPSNAAIQSDIYQAKQLTYVFPVIFFLVSILVIMTTISQIILRERSQIGTMKAIGIKPSTILSHYIWLSVSICAIGIAIGVCVGPWLIPMVMNVKYNILYNIPSMQFVFPFAATFGCMVLLLGLASLVSFIVVRKEVLLKPALSMRPKSPKNFRSLIKQTKTSKHIAFKMAIRNIRVNLSRAIMVIFGVLGCTALLVCGFGIDDTLYHGVDVELNNMMGSDILLSYNNGTVSKKDILLNINGVETVEEYNAMPTTIHNKDMYFNTIVYAIEEDSNFFNVKFDKEKIAITNKVAKETGLKSGDQIDFLVLGSSYTGYVDVVYDTFYSHGIFVSKQKYQDFAKTNSQAWVNIKDGENGSEILKEMSSLSFVSTGNTHEAMKTHILNLISTVKAMTLTVKVFAILLAIVVLYNLALLNFKERSRDIATLKVLGFSKREIAKSLILEVMILTIIGSIVGLFFGMPIMKLVLMINEPKIVSFLYTIYPLSYFVSVCITLLTSLLINIYLSLLTGRVKMVESLKSVE